MNLKNITKDDVVFAGKYMGVVAVACAFMAAVGHVRREYFPQLGQPIPQTGAPVTSPENKPKAVVTAPTALPVQGQSRAPH
ncbi:MAG: hypothetical protein RBR86_04100 [Pseudobdellovibrionaceae bacterium]|jgi:hypothetical protein|nr:hypothetical protein [Pseudobdellovibrionaceae bacterium]